MVASVKATISGPSKNTVTISVVEPEQNYIGKDISSNFSAHIMTMQAENIQKNTYAKRYIREI